MMLGSQWSEPQFQLFAVRYDALPLLLHLGRTDRGEVLLSAAEWTRCGEHRYLYWSKSR